MFTCALIVLCLFTASAHATQAVAQPRVMPSASAITDPWYPSSSGMPDTHGWFVAPVDQLAKGDPEKWRLWHVPPRRMARTDGKSHGAPDGSLRPSAILYLQPERLAAWGDKVYVAFKIAPPANGAFATRSVMSLRARPVGVGDLWGDDPQNTLDLCPVIKSAGRLLGITCIAGTPLALVDEQYIAPRSSEGAVLRLLRMDADGWINVELPPGLSTEGALGYELIESSGELLFAVWRRGGSLELLRGKLRLSNDQIDWNATIDWSASIARTTSEMESGASRGTTELVAAGDRLFVRELEVSDTGSGKARARISELPLGVSQHRDLPRRIASVEGAGNDIAVVSIPGMSRLLLAWHNLPEVPGLPSNPLGVCELSLNTGSTIYVGPAAQTSPISATDAKLLVITLAGLSALTLLFIIRTNPAEPELHLPDGFALAEPGRRLFAASIDALLAFCVGASLTGSTPGDLLTFEGLLSAQAIWALVYGLAVGMITGTLTEALSGRSLGKVLAGCAVIAIAPGDPRPPTFGASLIRNAVKWGLPPVAALALLDNAGRHRGETLARTAVVTVIEPTGGDDQGR